MCSIRHIKNIYCPCNNYLLTSLVSCSAQVSKLLDLIVNSIYSNKDIFIRELISNASDALDKVRFLGLNDEKYLKDDAALEIRIRADKEGNRLDIE